MKIETKTWAIILTVVFISLFSLGCNKQQPQKVVLTMSAASSLTSVMEDIKKIYTEENQDIDLVFNFGSSGVLQQQIEQGAPIDLYLSAAADQMDKLEQKGLIDEQSRITLLSNEIVLIGAKDSYIEDFTDLTNSKVSKLAIAVPESVPAGKYARELLMNLGIWESVQNKIIYAKDVRQVLAYVERGEVEAGIVYQTDANVSDKVKIIMSADPTSYSPILYPLAIIKGITNQKAAEDVIAFLAGEEAKEIFKQHGFLDVGK